MADLIYEEVALFGICVLLGMGLACIYDGIRIFRLLFRHWEWILDLEDLAYWILTAWLVFATLFRYNRGTLRGYAFLGMFLGVIVYMLTISRLLMYIVHKLLPGWERCRHFLGKPFVLLRTHMRKSLKKTVAGVKMALKGR